MSATSTGAGDGLTRLGAAVLASGIEWWARAWDTAARHAGWVSEAEPPPPAGATLVDRWRRFLLELAQAPMLALDRFGTELEEAPAPAPWRQPPGAPVIVPARVSDASQGLVVYAVSRPAVRTYLETRRLPFVPIELGDDRTALVATGVQYRSGELGSYDELGLAFVVAPARDPTAVGLHFFAMPVNGRRSHRAGTIIWGYPKTEERVASTLDESRASWTWRRRTGRHVLTITFPRGGRGASTAVPIPTYTVLRGRPYRAVFVRTGRGERLKASGDVVLTLGRGADPLVRTLRALGLPSAPVMLHAWTERMSGELRAPQPLGEAGRPPASVKSAGSGQRTSRRS